MYLCNYCIRTLRHYHTSYHYNLQRGQRAVTILAMYNETKMVCTYQSPKGNSTTAVRLIGVKHLLVYTFTARKNKLDLVTVEMTI